MKTFTRLSQIGLSGIVTTIQVVEALPDGTLLAFWNSSNNANRISDIPISYSLVTINRSTPNYVSCRAERSGAAVEEYKAYYRGDTAEKFSGWVKQATATPPQEYDLPLAAGYTPHGYCFYIKTQENVVYFAGGANVPDTYADGATVATLPAGYRPRRSNNYPATGQSGSTRTAMAVGVQVDGAIKCYGTLTGGLTNRVFFSGFFVVAP